MLPTLGQSFVTKQPFGAFPAGTSGYVTELFGRHYTVVLVAYDGSTKVSYSVMLTEDAMHRLTEYDSHEDRIRACIAKRRERV